MRALAALLREQHLLPYVGRRDAAYLPFNHLKLVINMPAMNISKKRCVQILRCCCYLFISLSI
jgi:hypothetical protein